MSAVPLARSRAELELEAGSPQWTQQLDLHTISNKYIQVSRIKERVEEKEGIPPVQQRLIFGGKQMYVMSPYV